MVRPSYNRYFMELAQVIKKRSTCLRRAVGCVIVNGKHQILSTGYNGVAADMPHCNEEGPNSEGMLLSEEMRYPHACPGARLPTTTGLDQCEAIHAEQNALLQCKNVDDIYIAYVTASPCMHCIKLLMNTPCHVIVFPEIYDKRALDLWVRSGRDYEHLI